jgi:hypothetical protein
MTNKTNATIAGIFATTLTFQTLPANAEGVFSLTSGVDYSSGKYGQSESTDITYIPFMAKYETDNTTLKLTVSWVKITGPGDVVGGSAPIVLGRANRPISTESGLGDAVLTATHTIAKLGEVNTLILDLTGKVKFATASVSKGLGTGKNDYSIALDAYKPISNNVTLFGDIGYKLLGDPNGINLNNVWFGTAGLSYKLNASSSAGMIADTRQATQNSSDPLRELTVFLSHKINEHYKLQSYITHGYSNASTDWGGGAMLSRSF